MGSSSRLLLLGLLAVAIPATARAEGLYLHVVPTTRVGRAPRDPGAPLRVAAYVDRPEAFAASLGAAVLAVGDDHVVLDLEPAHYPQLEPDAPERFLAPSFVVDFEEPPVAALHAALVERYGASPSVEELRRFTGEVVANKSSERGWDLASQVAASRTGDCTEHAVLLAALARAVGRPARVAVGLLVVTVDREPLAFGHAWAEIHDGERWLPADATPVVEEAETLGYLPVSLLENEGPGYALGLGRALQRAWVRRVEVRDSGTPVR